MVRHVMRKGFTAWLISLAVAVLWLPALPAWAEPALERVLMRAGEHAGFSRLVFDWDQPVDYTVAVRDDRLVITFNRVADIDLVDIKGSLSRISDPALSQEQSKLVVSFQLIKGAAVRDFRDQTKVVIDIADPPRGVKTSQTPTPEAASVSTPSAPAAEPQRIAQPTPEPAVQSAPEPAADEALAADAAEPAVADPVSYGPGQPIAVQYEPIFNGTRLSYPLPEPLPAAVFVRGGYLWVVFEKPRPVDHPNLPGLLGERIKSTEQIAHPLATILRYRVNEGVEATAHRRDGTWIVEVKDNRTSPQLPIDVLAQDIGGIPGVFLPVDNVGSRIRVSDPDIGDEIAITPVLTAGRGVMESRRFAQFQIIPTAQGVVVEVHADGVHVERYRNGVAVTAVQGLKLTTAQAATSLEQPDTHSAVIATPRRLVNLAAWRRGGAADYHTVRHALLQRLSMAQADARNSARWDLARFYIGHGLADQALGIMAVMTVHDPELEENAEFRAARGIAHVLMGRHGEARNDLAHAGLDAELDVYLWRGLAAAGMQDWQAALDSFQRGADMLADYEDGERVRFHLGYLRAAFRLGRADLAETQLMALSGMMLPAAVSAEVELIRGHLLAAAGDVGLAKEAYGKVTAAGLKPFSVEARLSSINLQLASQDVEPSAAIDALERLRFAWRGDDLELNLLDRLGQLYMQTGDYRTGLATLRQAVTYFDKSAHTRRLTDVMSTAFRDLFLGGQAERMPPLQALSLYYDYRELTPLGADGDNMIRRLADRLVSVDLLERAAELLEHQVRYRLQGVAQADVAGRLAMIYLLDRKPEKALAVMRATRQTMMPEDVETRRRHLEARALVDLRRYEEAEVLLEADTSREADMLRADLYWGASRWADVVRNAEKLLGRRWEERKPLSNDERRQVLRLAVAQSLAEDPDGLRSLRERYGPLMADGAYAAAFDVVTAKQDPSAREIQELTESIASVNTLEGFMTAYRKEFKGS
jgi:tetratricopeptide (TPR) repeat protein